MVDLRQTKLTVTLNHKLRDLVCTSVPKSIEISDGFLDVGLSPGLKKASERLRHVEELKSRRGCAFDNSGKGLQSIVHENF